MSEQKVKVEIVHEGFRFEQRNFVINEGVRFKQMSAYCYPNYEEKINLKVIDSSFPLSVENAETLRDLLNETLKVFGK